MQPDCNLQNALQKSAIGLDRLVPQRFEDIVASVELPLVKEGNTRLIAGIGEQCTQGRISLGR